MRYPDGQQMLLGDVLELWNGCDGVVVCSIDTDEYSDEYPDEAWSYLKSGVLIQSVQGGLIHYLQAEPSFRLKDRREWC